MLNADAIREHLGGRWPNAELRTLGSVTSTNDIAWAWAEAGCPEGTAVLAEEQVRGRGRFGRTWHCPRGRGVLLSVVLRPPSPEVSPAHLTATASLAVAEAIEPETGLTAALRWPNDVTVNGRKVAGILVERRVVGASGPLAPSATSEPLVATAPCIVGIGLNVNTRLDELPDDVRGTATSLALEAGTEFSRERLAAAVLNRLGDRYADVLAGQWLTVASLWQRRASLVGQTVTVTFRARTYEGRVLHADPLGRIEIELAGGERREFRAEHASLALAPSVAQPR